MRTLGLTLVILFGLLVPSVQAAVWQITYPRALIEDDLRNDYPLALLTLALNKTGVRYELKPSNRIMLQGKALRQLRENRSVNIVWSMTDQQREAELHPIRIPINKGLIGWRVFLVHRDKARAFANVHDAAALRQFIPVQGEDWPDTKILQSNGFDVETVTSYLDNFALISRFQADFFPRSVIEVLSELKLEGLDPEIVLEKKLALHYPSAMYFFTNKGNSTLANLIKTGLERAIEDGSFDQLFLAHHEPILKALNMSERTVFRLENSLLSEKTPLDKAAYWYDPTGKFK